MMGNIYRNIFKKNAIFPSKQNSAANFRFFLLQNLIVLNISLYNLHALHDGKIVRIVNFNTLHVYTTLTQERRTIVI